MKTCLFNGKEKIWKSFTERMCTFKIIICKYLAIYFIIMYLNASSEDSLLVLTIVYTVGMYKLFVCV